MVSRMLDRRGDVVAERLARDEASSSSSVIEWLEAEQERGLMRRRARRAAPSQAGC